MLLPEPRLDLLLDQLKAMPARDRGEVLRRLPALERNRIHDLLRGRTPRAAESPYSSDIAARIAALSEAKCAEMTEAGRTALAVALDLPIGMPAKSAARGASLADAIGGLLRPRRAGS